MPKLQLTQQFVDNPPVVKLKTKTDYFDTRLTGFFLEVRATGKATYYQRYRDKHRKNRQVRIGPADAMSLEEARKTARQVRSSITDGLDPRKKIGDRPRFIIIKVDGNRVKNRKWEIGVRVRIIKSPFLQKP